MRRTTGAILMEMRPERIRRSAWRGEARKASKPKRAMSSRAPTTDIISMAQQARPKVARNWRIRKSSGVPAFSRFTISMAYSVLAPLEGAATPHIYERDDQEADEDRGLDQGERPERPQLHGDRVEEHDLDVEQDEQHRD